VPPVSWWILHNNRVLYGLQKRAFSGILRKSSFLCGGSMSAAIPTDRIITYQLQYRKCATRSCTHCRSGRGHGPYWYAYWREGTRMRLRYIPRRFADEEVFPCTGIGLINSRATLTMLPLEQHAFLISLTEWASELTHITLHTIFLSRQQLIFVPVLEGTTKTLLFLHFCGNASLQCAPNPLKDFAPVSFSTLQQRYGPIYAQQPRLFVIDQALLDQFTWAYQEAASKRGDFSFDV
jgi:hypothetical protein